MGSYVNVQAKKDCGEQINNLWKTKFQNSEHANSWLIYTPEIIQSEIDYIKENSLMPHLNEQLNSIDDWNSFFPVYAEGCGQIFIASASGMVSKAQDENDPQEIVAKESLRKQVQFVLDHRFLFEKIVGLNDAQEILDMDIPGEYWEDNTMQNYQQWSFANLPISPHSKLYNLCIEYDRPDLWGKYVDFSNAPNMENWENLRSCVVPWSTVKRGSTVWQICEITNARREQSGQDNLWLTSKYKDEPPRLFEVDHALTIEALNPSHSQADSEEGFRPR